MVRSTGHVLTFVAANDFSRMVTGVAREGLVMRWRALFQGFDVRSDFELAAEERFAYKCIAAASCTSHVIAKQLLLTEGTAAAKLTVFNFNVCIDGLRQIRAMSAPKMAVESSRRHAVLQDVLYGAAVHVHNQVFSFVFIWMQFAPCVLVLLRSPRQMHGPHFPQTFLVDRPGILVK